MGKMMNLLSGWIYTLRGALLDPCRNFGDSFSKEQPVIGQGKLNPG